ncbi:nesprin-2a [Brachionichthys hirsutus]|uniref:nesprin-2a n=1 Tax=Brachionichthys hirsutus TaxID=412623 RepID=UPI0036052CE1
MQDIFSEIQSLVERSDVITRTPHTDLDWHLKFSPGEPAIRLMRTVHNVLACRYQPARLDVTAMTQQLQEAENYRSRVQEQVATVKCMDAAQSCDPDVLDILEGQCSAALLDASATVQVKATQLDQVKQYHKQMRLIKTFLEVLAAEKEKTSLSALRSSALQSDKLNALLKSMTQKKSMMEELLHLSSQFSVHLSEAESSGALLAQLGDVQEEWRLLEGSFKRALQHASSSTCQSSLLMQGARQLKDKLEDLQKSNFQKQDSKSALELVCLKTDFKLHNQTYLQLQSRSDALFCFSLGHKERDEIEHSLKELKSSLSLTKSKLDTCCGGRINKHLQDLILWARQAENHITTGQKLALFPEEARIQIIEMKKLQNEFWTRKSKMQEAEQIRDVTFDICGDERDLVLKTIEDLFKAISDNLDHGLDTMKINLQNRETLFCQLARLDAWLAKTHAKSDPCLHVENVSKADVGKLESELKCHQLATVETKSQLKLLQAMTEGCRDVAVGLNPGESRYLVNRMSGLWAELDGLLAHEEATCWELQELIHERIYSKEELSTIQASLQLILTGLEQQRFPCTRETRSTIERFKHVLLEHQCEVQELQHCQKAERSALLCTIGEMQDQCKALAVSVFEQDKYLRLRKQMEDSRDKTKEQLQRVSDETVSVSERFRLCQTLLIGLPLVKTQCQEAADQLEAIAQDLCPSELAGERQRIRRAVETLVSWEDSVRDGIKNLEGKLLLGMHFSSELPALIELFRTTRVELEGAEPLDPDGKVIDVALQRHWVIWRNMESGMRFLEGLGQKENIDLKNYEELFSLQDKAKQECHLRMESLAQARESLKDYQWAARGATDFLHNAEATFLSAPGGFLDCTEEQRQTQQALEALENGFKAHIDHLIELLPQQPHLSRSKTEERHIAILSQLLVGRAMLEAQAQLRLESLQRCKVSQGSHKKCHEEVRLHLSELEAKISECSAERVTSYDKCVAQRKRAELLLDNLRNLSGKIEELRTGCPMQGCSVGRDGELGALWRCWVSLRRGVGFLMARNEQRGEEWKDITTSMEQCCGFLASLQADVPDSSAVSFTTEEPHGLLIQAETHQAELEQEQLALASLEHRLEHALSLSSSQDAIGPGPVGKTLVKIRENVRSLKERNLLMVAAAQAEGKERQRVQEEIGEVEHSIVAIRSLMEVCTNPRKQQDLGKDLSSQKAKLRRIVDSVQRRYDEIPADINRSLQEAQRSIQREEKTLVEKSEPVQRLDGQLAELESGLENIKVLLEQRSPSVSEAKRVLKHVWDELDAWHSRLMLLENEVQDLTEARQDQAHLLMDRLTQPLQLYQNAARRAEQRTTFLSKIPARLQEFESVVFSSGCWMEEARSWLSGPSSFTTAKSLQSHANSLQLVLDDSKRIRHALQDFRPGLDEASAVCDVSTQEEKLDQVDQQVHKMQRKLLEPLEQLLQAVGEVEAAEAELKTIEKNVPKIRAILSSMDSSVPLMEHLHNRQVIMANVQSMQRTLEEMERCKGQLRLPRGAEDSLLVFSRARLLLQPLEELEQLTREQSTLLETCDHAVVHADTKSIEPGGATEETRLIPAGPTTEFTRASDEFTEEGDKDTSMAPSHDLEQSGVINQSDSLEAQEPTSTGSDPAALRQLHESVAALRQMLSSDQLCFLDEFELGRSELFPGMKDVPSLEQRVQTRHLRASPGGRDQLQRVYRSLLQGITGLLELGEESIREGQTSQFPSCSQLHAVLCRREKLLQVLGSQLAFVQNLFQREPEALRCQEDERVQLEVRARALLQQALEQEVASQRSLGLWTRWEGNCGRVGRLLDDLEAFIGCEAPQDDDEKLRLDVCQTLVLVDEIRVALGLLLDQGAALQAESECAAAVGHAGGALELRWRGACRRMGQEVQRRSDSRDSRVSLPRFQADFASVTEWLIGASQHLAAWLGLANTSDLKQEAVHDHLIKLLDFSMETEAMSLKREAASKTAARLLQMREADWPRLRTDLAQMEADWNQLTSDLSNVQSQLRQQLLPSWPPLQLLPDLEDWLRTLEARLNQEKETLLQAEDGARISESLQRCQELKVGMINGQLLLDFMCQSEPRPVVQALSDEHTVFAEKLGALRLRWLQVRMELEGQICAADQMRHTCVDRERKLSRLGGWIELQEKELDQGKQPAGQTLARRILLELEAVEGRANEAAASLQELKSTRVHVEKRKDHPCDASFSGQTESVCNACGDLSRQIAALRPALHLSLEELRCFEGHLKEASLLTTRTRCSLNHHSLFSLKQTEGCLDLLQLLLEQVGKGEELWVSAEESYQRLGKIVPHGTSQALEEQMEGERQRWKDVVQELKETHVETGETLNLWKRYGQLFDQRSLHLRTLWRQWEELRRPSPQRDPRAVQQLQEAVEDLQSNDDVYSASKSLIGRLEPRAAGLIQSETRSLSRDILLLRQATSGEMMDDLEERKRFHSRLEALEKQTENIQIKLKSGVQDKDSAKQVLLDLSVLFASLVDVRETSGRSTLESQRLLMLTRKWAENMTHMSEVNRQLQAEHQRSQSFPEKCRSLSSIQEKLEEGSSKKPQSYSALQETLIVQQQLQTEIIRGHRLLQGLLLDAVESTGKETGGKRSELLEQANSVKESWFSSVARVDQHRSWMKDQLNHWRVYKRGLKLLWKLLRNIDPLLQTGDPDLQSWSCMDDRQDVEDVLGLHGAVYAQTLEAGGCLLETVTESECRSRIESEIQAVREAWGETTSMVERRRNVVDTVVLKWSRCQDRIAVTMSELDELETKLKPRLSERTGSSEAETVVQEAELCLQRLAGELRELATMKTDLSRCVPAGDSALLEQQLDQLRVQWEEMCTKVSQRRQEIADRLNAWTIFNDENKEFCDWLTWMEDKVCHSSDLGIEETVEKLKKDCMEEINLFSENKSRLKELGGQLLLASDRAQQAQVHGSLQEVDRRWHGLFHHMDARVKKLKETLVTVQQLDKNMSSLRPWLSRIEAALTRPVTYSVLHHQEIQRRLAEQKELQRDIEQHTEAVASVLSLCDVLLRDEDAAVAAEVEGDSLQETNSSLDQRWRTICAMALDRRLRIEETWKLWCKFLNDYSRFEDWLKVAECTAADANSADILYTVAKEELKKFEGFQRQVQERLTQLELVNNQYRRLARENRTDRASHLKAMVHEGNRRWDSLHRRVAAILRRLKYFTSQREEFDATRESMLVWLTELDLQLTDVEHFSESDVHHKIQQLNSFQKEIALNTERIDGLIVFGEALIQKSSPQDGALIEDELEELHSYCQEVFGRLVRFHQRLSQPPIVREEPELSGASFSLESSLELIGRPWLVRGQGSLPATPTHLPASPLVRSGRETPVSVDSLPLEWDHTGDVGGSSSHGDEEEEEEEDEEGAYFSALSESTESLEDFVEAREALRASSLVSSRSLVLCESPRWRSQEDVEALREAPPTSASTPLKQGYLRLMSQCSGSIEDFKGVSLIPDEEEEEEEDQELSLTRPTASDKQSGATERWEPLHAWSRSDLRSGPQQPQRRLSDLDGITSWLKKVIPALERSQNSDPAGSLEDVAVRAKELKEMQGTFASYEPVMRSVNMRARDDSDPRERLAVLNRDWSRVRAGLQRRDASLRKTLMSCHVRRIKFDLYAGRGVEGRSYWLTERGRSLGSDTCSSVDADPGCRNLPSPSEQEFQESLHSLLLWLGRAETRRDAAHIGDRDAPARTLQQRHKALTGLRTELQGGQARQASLQALWSQLQPEEEAEERGEAREKLHVTGSKLGLLLRQVDQDIGALELRLMISIHSCALHVFPSRGASREKSDSSSPCSFFCQMLRAIAPLLLLLLLLLLLPCLIPLSETDPTCAGANNFARSFYPMLRYTNGPPPT